jgi:hypothetical protein
MRFQVLVTTNIKIMIFLDMTPRSVIDTPNLKQEAAGSAETLVYLPNYMALYPRSMSP